MPDIWLTLWSSRSRGLTGLHWNIYPRCLDQNVQDLDVGKLELFRRCLNVKYAQRLQNFTNASRSRKSAMFVFHKPVLSLPRPNFLTGAIIETRFQASLLAPLDQPLLCVSFAFASYRVICFNMW